MEGERKKDDKLFLHNFRQLTIWQESMELAKSIHIRTSVFPTEERYGLKSQLNRCSVSVPSNIAEGSSRSSDKEFSHFIKISLGSLFELETQITLAYEFKLIQKTDFENLLDSIVRLQKMITNFLKTLNK